MTSSDSGTWNPESFDRGLTECGTCGTRSNGIDEASLRKLVAAEIRKYLASTSPDATVACSPLAEGGGSGGEGCEAQGRSEDDGRPQIVAVHTGALLAAIESRRGDKQFMDRIRQRVDEDEPILNRLRLSESELLIADLRARVSQADAERDRLESEVTARARSVIAANGRTERVEAALVRIRGERDSAVISADQWKADAIQADKDRDYLRKFLNETVRERDEARTALAVARAQAESEAVARAEAEAELAALPEKIAAKIMQCVRAKPRGDFETGMNLGYQASVVHARSFAASAEPVPEPVREWGVQHGEDCQVSGAGHIAHRRLKADAEESVANLQCAAVLVSRVPGGEWEAAE